MKRSVMELRAAFYAAHLLVRAFVPCMIRARQAGGANLIFPQNWIAIANEQLTKFTAVDERVILMALDAFLVGG